ncbi:Na+/H+ antiporter NhaA [Liberibacter sp. Z1]|nr:Na+/H+ antiporter NhaA [Candidatus Liberibacter sp.]
MHYFHSIKNRFLGKFISLVSRDSSVGILLISLTIVTTIFANMSFSTSFYFSLLEFKIFNVTFKHWINDVLMSFFFLMIGLEIKHALIEGELSSWEKRSLPFFAAVGGMILPALIYLFFNRNDTIALKGWAIPTTTDIAFTLGILSLMGSHFPYALKIFFIALTTIDDLIAVVIIAIFYTQYLSFPDLGIATALTLLLLGFNRFGITHCLIYGIFGGLLWFFTFKSGIHTTIAGVILAMFLPFQKISNTNQFSFNLLGNYLKPWVNFLVLPAFVFANSGVSLSAFSLTDLFDPVIWGIILGLFLGKQIGIILFSFSLIKMKWGILPKGSNWYLLYGGAILCGTGFTMSLFIACLAFPHSYLLQEKAKIGILLASTISSIIASYLIKIAKNKKCL